MSELDLSPHAAKGGDESARRYRELGSPDVPEQEASAERDRPSRLIVEVGAGRYSGIGAWHCAAERREFGPQEQYIGIDLGTAGGSGADYAPSNSDPDQLMRERWAGIQRSRPDEHIQFLHADGTVLPVAENIADEVLFANVFGFGAAHDQWAGLFKEANRVVKPDGVIIIQDNQSPYHGSFSRMNEVVRDAGLLPEDDKMRLVRETEHPEEYARIVERHGFEPNPLFHNNIAWEIRKLHSQPVPKLPGQPEKEKKASRRPFWRRK